MVEHYLTAAVAIGKLLLIIDFFLQAAFAENIFSQGFVDV
jgi:hypothetical protein